jgi:hypothetical protein
MQNIQETFEHETETFQVKIRGHRNSCQHELTTYYPDPSGNNDSYTECNICGAELSKKFLKDREKLTASL